MLLEKMMHWMQETPMLLKASSPIVSHVPFEHAATNVSDYTGNPRLGFLYQYLWLSQFNDSKNHDVIVEELQLIENKRTLGAIDFIVHNTPINTFEHWEIAVKFYLLHTDLWYGPNSRDRLDLKLDRMLHHQLAMSESKTFKKAYPHITETTKKLAMQGRLYINPFDIQTVPFECLAFEINEKRITGKWCYQHQYSMIREDLYILHKDHWLTGKECDSKRLTALPDHFVHCQSQSGQFWFIVPDRWPN